MVCFYRQYVLQHKFIDIYSRIEQHRNENNDSDSRGKGTDSAAKASSKGITPQ